ncbi:MAG: AbrB/MazE/SpoVT family DNA-binding domain-containing protein [Actinomycetota bacterium]|nr:AbrB/MazE/SpoVT family DNA-binding domain-containing protein [Actinomycetota bacterium]
MRSVIKKWGNSASVRIPSSIMEAAHLAIDDSVEIREEAGRIVIDSIRGDEYDLTQLLEAIDPDNLHGEIDFGITFGRELL